MSDCPCGSKSTYADCCEPLLKGEKKAKTAEQLMRSRFSAYAKSEIKYLVKSAHPSQRKNHDEEAMKEWADEADWHNLEVVRTERGGENDKDGIVEFKAHFAEDGESKFHHEIAEFRKKDNEWFFFDGKSPKLKPVVRTEEKVVYPNMPCPCGSGKKYKKCCMRNV